MIELRTINTTEDEAVRKLAKRIGAYLEVTDEDPGNKWYTMTEYAADDDEVAAQVKEIVGGRYEVI